MLLSSPSKLISLTLRIAYYASHKKIALRTRKRMKKIPMSETKLKQLKYIKTEKQLQQEQQIIQRLKHKSDINRHAKEVAEELFFPDIKYSSPDVMAKSFSLQHDSKYMGGLNRELRNTLNSELLDTFSISKSQFEGQHYYQLFNQFYYNCFHFAEIKKKFVEKWKKYQDTMKRKGNVESIPFPYKFIDHKDLVAHPVWKQLISQLNTKIQSVDNDGIIDYIQICHLLRDTVGYIPSSTFEAMVMRGLELMRKRKLVVKTRLEMIRLSLEKDSIKLEKKVVVEEDLKFKNKLMKMVDNGLLDLSNVEILTTDALETIIACMKAYPNANKPERILKKIFKNFMGRFYELSFKSVLEALKLYMSFNLLDAQYIEIFKFDLYRKVASSELSDVLDLMQLVQKGKIKGTEVQGITLLQVCNQRVIQSLKLHQLNAQQLIGLLKCNYSNGYKNLSLLNLISNEIVRISKDIQFEDYLDMFCLLTVEGVRSLFLRDSALERVQKQLKNLRRQYKEEAPKYLPTLNKKSDIEPIKKERQFTASQIRLNQEMIKFLWAYIRQTEDNKINVNVILENFPSLDYEATHPLLIDMVEEINNKLKQFLLFPKLKKGELKRENYLNLDYYYQKHKQGIDQLLQLEADIHKQYVQRQGIKTQVDTLIKQVWSNKGTTSNEYQRWLTESKLEQLFFKTENPNPALLKKLLQLKRDYKLINKESNNVNLAKEQNKRPKVEFYELSESEEDIDK